MSLLNTLGNEGYEGCHFSSAGYAEMADRMAPVVARDFYGVIPPSPVTAPNLVRAYFTSNARTAIALEFDQAMSWSSFSLPNWYVNDVGGLVSSGSASGNVVTLQLSGPVGQTATLDYLKDASWSHTESVPSLLYGANGIPALTFADVPVSALTPYQDWANGYPAADLSDPDADLDKDGLSNDEERLWGLDPTSGTSPNPVIFPLDRVAGTMTYQRRSPSLTGGSFRYEWSTTLGSGEWTPFTPLSETPSGTSPVETVQITLPASLLESPSLFIRVVATSN
jgi:hypothetical protein